MNSLIEKSRTILNNVIVDVHQNPIIIISTFQISTMVVVLYLARLIGIFIASILLLTKLMT